MMIADEDRLETLKLRKCTERKNRQNEFQTGLQSEITHIFTNVPSLPLECDCEASTPDAESNNSEYESEQGRKKSIVIDIRLRYSLLFVHQMHWSLYFFECVSNMALSLLFFRRNSIFQVRFFLSRLLYLTLVNLK